MRGTRLWQDTGSPLISGRSRRERRFWKDWLLGTVLGLVLSLVTVVAFERGGSADLRDILPMVLITALPVTALASAATVWLASKFGWRRRWLMGALVSWPLAWASVWSSAQYLSDLLN